MSVLKGYPGKKRDLNPLTNADVHVTAEPIGEQVALNVTPKGAFLEEISTGNIAEAGSNSTEIVLTAHSMQVGDVIRFDSNNKEARVVLIKDANTVRLGEELPFDPTALSFSINRPLTPKVNSDGTLPVASLPLKFRRDGAEQEVVEDTVTPANNRPLPVKLTDVTGDINITANDLNVQIDHSNDSVRVGDGTDLLEITAAGEALTSDATTHSKLDTAEATRSAMQTEQLAQGVSLDDINTELDSQTALLTTIDADTGSIDTKLSTTNTELSGLNTELALKLDEATFTSSVGEVSATPTANTLLGRLKDVDDALASLLAELQLKADLSETQPVSAASLPLPTGAATETTLASLESKDFATQTTLAALLTELQAKADLTETQPVSAASLPLPTGAATEATLASIDGKDFATQTTLAAVLTELQAKADLTETQPVSAASLPLPAGAATETTLGSILTELQAKADLSETQPVSAASLPLPTGAATEASLAAQAADISLLEDRLAGSLVPDAHDYIAVTYVASGNGEGEIETATYKTGGAGGTTVATLTLAYDANNRLTSVTKA